MASATSGRRRSATRSTLDSSNSHLWAWRSRRSPLRLSATISRSSGCSLFSCLAPTRYSSRRCGDASSPLSTIGCRSCYGSCPRWSRGRSSTTCWRTPKPCSRAWRAMRCCVRATAGPRSPSAAWAALAAASVVAATLIKGPVGLFPLTVPVLFFILPAASRPRHPAIVWIAFAAVTGALVAALLATPSARSALGAFMTTHLAPTLGGDRGAGPRGADFLRHLALGIWLRMAVVVGLVWLFRRRERVAEFMGRPAAFFFAATFASSLPILISPGTRRALLLSIGPVFRPRLRNPGAPGSRVVPF